MPRRPFAVFLALASLLLLAGCNAQPTRQRGTAYPAPPDVGPSVESRHVNFTNGDSIAFSAFKRKVHSRTTGQALTLLIEPPVEVDAPDAVAQAKFLYDTGPVYHEDLPDLTAVILGYRSYASYAAYYARNQRAANPFTFIVPLTQWQLHLLFPTSGEPHVLSINTGRFALPISADDRERLITAVATWQPVYDALARAALPSAEALTQQLAADADQPHPTVTLHEGEPLAAWRVARHTVTFDSTRISSPALDQTVEPREATGYRLLAAIEPAYLHANAVRAVANRDLQLRLLFEALPRSAPQTPPLPAPTRVRFHTRDLSQSWSVSPTPDAPNHFAAHLPADSIGKLLGTERMLQLDVTHGDTTRTYTLDTNNLGQVLNHLPDAFFDVDDSALP